MMPTHQRAEGMPVIQLDVPTCQGDVNFLTWHVNVPRGVPIFQLPLTKDILQPWTKLVETKVKNPVNSRND